MKNRMNLTIWWFGYERLAVIAWFTRTSWVNSSHPELVLITLLQVLQGDVSRLAGNLGGFGPAGGEAVLALNDVFGDFGTAVVCRWRPFKID